MLAHDDLGQIVVTLQIGRSLMRHIEASQRANSRIGILGVVLAAIGLIPANLASLLHNLGVLTVMGVSPFFVRYDV